MGSKIDLIKNEVRTKRFRNFMISLVTMIIMLFIFVSVWATYWAPIVGEATVEFTDKIGKDFVYTKNTAFVFAVGMLSALLVPLYLGYRIITFSLVKILRRLGTWDDFTAYLTKE